MVIRFKYNDLFLLITILDALNDFEEDTPQTKSESSDDTEQKTQPPNNEQMVENMNRVFEMMSENIENMVF